MPLLYVIRVALVPPEDDDEDPAFRDEDSKYISIDMEMIACAPILSDEADTSDEEEADEVVQVDALMEVYPKRRSTR